MRALALGIACDIHPLNNLRVLRYLKSSFGRDDAQREEWTRHWIALGFEAARAHTGRSDSQTGSFCHGEYPTLADCCLVPQIANSQRVQLPLDAYPTLRRINANCLRLRPSPMQRPGPSPMPNRVPRARCGCRTICRTGSRWRPMRSRG